MTTTHERGAHAVLSRMLTLETTATALVRIRQRLAAGTYFAPGYVAAVGQLHRSAPGRWPVHHVAAFLDIHSGIGAGRYALVQVEVGAEPQADAEREANAAALTGLPDPFTADLDMQQNAADDDGTVAWGAPIEVTRCTGAANIANCSAVYPVTAPTAVTPFRVPLEVGTTMPSRTLLHLEEDGGVARWAYGSKDLHLLLNLRHPLVQGRLDNSPGYRIAERMPAGDDV